MLGTIRLWHFTGKENVEPIRTGGFVLSEALNQSGVFFSLAGETNWYFEGRGLVEVWLEIDEQELARFKQVAGDGSRYIDFYVIPPDRILQCAKRWSFHADINRADLERIARG